MKNILFIMSISLMLGLQAADCDELDPDSFGGVHPFGTALEEKDITEDGIQSEIRFFFKKFFQNVNCETTAKYLKKYIDEEGKPEKKPAEVDVMEDDCSVFYYGLLAQKKFGKKFCKDVEIEDLLAKLVPCGKQEILDHKSEFVREVNDSVQTLQTLVDANGKDNLEGLLNHIFFMKTTKHFDQWTSDNFDVAARACSRDLIATFLVEKVFENIEDLQE